MRTHRNSGEFLQIVKPEKRGAKRKLEDPEVRKLVKKMLKKRKASPAKVAKLLSASPKFKGTVCRGTIYNNMGPSSKSGTRLSKHFSKYFFMRTEV